MNVLLDTNIILNVIRARNPSGIINYINPENSFLYISIVSEAEIRSLALRNNWGKSRIQVLNNFLNQINIIEINQILVNIYSEIDSFSQRLNPSFQNYSFNTPRNMGKNDLWIASLAALLGLKLVTTDADFDHLQGIFLEVRKIKSDDFQKYF